MAQTIKLKRSATTGNVPTTSQLALGELGINTTDGKLFLKKSVSGTESIVEVGSTASFLPLSGGTLTGNLSLGDNVKAQFGASNDLQIFHTGSYSAIKDVGTGALFIGGDNYVDIGNSGLSQTRARFYDGTVQLHSGGEIKLATTSTGIDVTGSVTADGLTVDGAGSIGLVATDRLYMATSDGLGIQLDKDNNRIVPVGADGSTYNNNVSLGSSGLEFKNLFLSGSVVADGLTVDGDGLIQANMGAKLEIKSTDNFINNGEVVGSLDFISADYNYSAQPIKGQIRTESVSSTGDSAVIIATTETTNLRDRILINKNGNIIFYEDTGTTPKLVWSAANEDLNFADGVKATFGAGDDLALWHDGANSHIRDQGTGNLQIEGQSDVKIMDNLGSTTMATFRKNGPVFLAHNNSTKFATTATGIDVVGKVSSDGLEVDLSSSGDAELTGAINSNAGLVVRDPTATAYGAHFSYDDANTVVSIGGKTNGTKNTAITIGRDSNDISFYDSSGNQGFFFDSSTSRLGLGTTVPSEKLHLQSSYVGSGSGEVAVRMTVPASSISAQNEIRSGVTGGTNPYMSFAVRETSAPYSTVEKLRINADGSSVFSGTLQSEKLIITQYGAPALKIIPDPAFSNEPEHDLIYTGYQSNLQDYLSIKAAGNSSTFHGVLAISDVGIYFGRTHVETGSPVGNSATSPFDASNYGYINNTGLTVNGTISSGAITSSGLTVSTASSVPTFDIITTHPSGIPILNLKGAASAQIRYQDENGNNQSRIDFNDAGAFNFINATDNSSHLVLNSSGNVNIPNGGLMVGSTTAPKSLINLIGTGSDGGILTLENNSTSLVTGRHVGQIDFYSNDGSSNGAGVKAKITAVAENSIGSEIGLTFGTSGTGSSTAVEAMRIDSSGSVGINNSLPSSQDASANNLVIEDSSGNGGLTIKTPTTAVGGIHFSDGTSGADRYRGIISYSHSENSMRFHTDTARAMTIDSSGRVGIGTSSPSGAYTQPSLHIHATGNGSELHLTDVTTGATSSDGMSIFQYANDGYIHMRENGSLRTYVNGAERMRLNADGSCRWTPDGTNHDMTLTADGNLLVGKTSADASVAGTEIRPNLTAITSAGDTPLYLRRTTNDGEIINFKNKDGLQKGNISVSAYGMGFGGGTRSSDFFIKTDGTASFAETVSAPSVGKNKIGLQFVTTNESYGIGAIQPYSISGTTNSDAKISLGNTSNARFDDICAMNGTIQTSDRNEKQDIESLTEAEERVAVVAKGLFKKFRWKSAVQDKGDDARIHFGIIAQDLQAAFEAEGLDAGRYGMFTSDTWTEDGVEKTRMGVRYSELLAFIISAI